MGPRYVLHPRAIRSNHDGQIHYIPAARLASLYKVAFSDCVVVYEGQQETLTYPKDCIHLYPKQDGKYELPCAK